MTKTHLAPNFVISCLDYRFQKEFLRVCDEKLGKKSYDYLTFPGASKGLIDKLSRPVIFECIAKISVLHQTKKVIILDHQDCGAWGGSQRFAGDERAEEKFHQQKLQQAGRILQSQFPDLAIELLYYHSSGAVTQV